jgi:hypothetical protein
MALFKVGTLCALVLCGYRNHGARPGGMLLGVFFDVKNPMKVGVELLSCAMKLVLFRAWRRHQLISRIDVAGGQISRLRSWLWSFACEALLAT